MDVANASKDHGVLVLQTGRQAGVRRPLGASTTFIGRSQKCDIRVNVDGVDPLHCLLVRIGDSVELRDLDSTQGTFVNGTRLEQAILRTGDVIKVGPFQFRLELPAALPAAVESSEEIREALRVQAAAVAAQQAALEEEEMRLQQRRAELQQQEEQLAAHLSEKQRQVQLWADYTKSERDAVRREKIEQEKQFAKLEKELGQARDEIVKERQQVGQARLRIEKIYQRLRLRWQRQWASERDKYNRQFGTLVDHRDSLEARERDLRDREAAFSQEVVRASGEHELQVRTLQEQRETLKKDQESWRRRRSQEHQALKARARDLEQTQDRIKQIRDLLMQEKHAWDKQLDGLHKELLGLNDRIIHQRLRVQEQQEELARLETAVRELRTQAADPATNVPAENAAAPPAEMGKTAPTSPGPDVAERRLQELDRLAGELADQRLGLVEQYERLANVQAAWQEERAAIAQELQAQAERLVQEEEAVGERERQAQLTAGELMERTRRFEAARQELDLRRDKLKLREQAFAQQHQREMLFLRQHQALLEEQLAALAVLRQRWNARRQKEMEQMQADREILSREHKETQGRRLAIFEKGQQLDEEKRTLAEKALALEQYRQDVFLRAKDPGAQKRIERLRRRWLMLNSTLIRNAKTAGEIAKKEMVELIDVRAELTRALGRLSHEQAVLAERLTSLQEREAALRIRQQELDLESRRRAPDDAETIAQLVYQEPDLPAIDKAA